MESTNYNCESTPFSVYLIVWSLYEIFISSYALIWISHIDKLIYFEFLQTLEVVKYFLVVLSINIDMVVVILSSQYKIVVNTSIVYISIW